MLAAPIARALPASWQWPQRMATRALDMPMWEAGKHLMIADAPANWNALVDAWNVVQDNRKAIKGCRKAAAKASVRCDGQHRAGGVMSVGPATAMQLAGNAKGECPHSRRSALCVATIQSVATRLPC